MFTDAGAEPLVAVALHDGHQVRDALVEHLAVHAAARFREEDPFTREWTTVASTRIVGLRSRFEVDLNRPRDKAVYLTPEASWGLRVWSRECPSDEVEQSLAQYDEFYRRAGELFTAMASIHDRFVVFDLHSYNHRRNGFDALPAPANEHPEVNLGTATMDRELWAPVVDRFVAELRSRPFMGRRIDVRENVKFFGGHFARWAHENFAESACVLSIEFKKMFMDEWTGEPYPDHIEAARDALARAIPGVLQELDRIDASRAPGTSHYNG